MAREYNIASIDGVIVIQPESRDNTSTSLDLAGRNYANWGEPYAQNFVNLLQNFAGEEAPANPRTGQLWFDSHSKTLKVFKDADWRQVGADADGWGSPMTLTLAGDATGSVSFDGTQNKSLTVALVTKLTGTGQTNAPGFYSSPAITVDKEGRVVGITNQGSSGTGPTTYVQTFNGRGGVVTLTSADITSALGFLPTQTPTALQIKTGLGYTPLNKAGDQMLGALDMNFNPISKAGNITGYGNLRLNTAGVIVDMFTNRVQNIGAPVAATDAATKGYVDSKVAGANVTVSTSAPSGGNEGDVWYRY